MAILKRPLWKLYAMDAALATQTGVAAEGLLLGTVQEDLASLGKYGIQKIHQVNAESLNQLDAEQYIRIISTIAESSGATVIILSHTNTGRAIAPGLSVRLKAGLVTGATGLPDTNNGFLVKKNVFSGKAFCTVSIKTAVKIISLNPNVYPVVSNTGSAEIVEDKIPILAFRYKDQICFQSNRRDSADRSGNCGKWRTRHERSGKLGSD